MPADEYPERLFRSLTAVHTGYHQFGDSFGGRPCFEAKFYGLGLTLGCRLPGVSRRIKWFG